MIRDSYEKREAALNEVFSAYGAKVVSIHRFDDPIKAVRDFDGYLVSGGNTWVLNKTLHDKNLIVAIQREVTIKNKPYIGWSAGSNIACPTIRTTNDMPIISATITPALGLIPFQLNPHYIDAHIEGHKGETRQERIIEFLKLNPKQTVVGLREGNLLHITGEYQNAKMSFISPDKKTLRIFESCDNIYELDSEADFSFLFK